MRKPLALLFALSVAMLSPAGPAQAQIDWRKVVPPRINVPGVLPDVVGPRGVGPHRNLIPSSSLRRALGALAVGAIGVAILSSLNESQRRDVAQRVNRIVLGPRDREVVEVYEVNKKKKVKIVVSPVAPKCSFKNDPALIPVAAPGAEEEKPKKPAKGKDEAKEDEGAVDFKQVPKETQCRRIQVAELGDTKSDAPSAAETSAAVVCELTPGDWRPTQFSPRPQPMAADTPPSDPSCLDS
jgi:hypothetical protein